MTTLFLAALNYSAGLYWYGHYTVLLLWGRGRLFYALLIIIIIIYSCCCRSAYAIDHAPTDAGGACKTSSQRTRARTTRDHTILITIQFLLIACISSLVPRLRCIALSGKSRAVFFQSAKNAGQWSLRTSLYIPIVQYARYINTRVIC